MALPRAAPPNWPDVVCRSTTNCSALENAKVKRKETTIAMTTKTGENSRVYYVLEVKHDLLQMTFVIITTYV